MNGRAAVFPLVAIRRRLRRGFTLIELLMVVGLIGILAAGVAMALRDTGGSSLATGQTTLASLVGTARAQAAVNQTETRLLIYGTRPPAGEPEKFLRLLQVVRADPPGSNTWVPVGGAVYLPRGIYVVPTATTGLIAAGTRAWPTNPPLLSTLGAPFNPVQPTGTPFAPPASAYFLEFNPDGTVTQIGTQNFARLLVATATINANVPQFNNPDAVRGILIRPTGAITFVNEAASF
jgi:prepilin-type N-terminal cleavage/methylation domain-containing protein